MPTLFLDNITKSFPQASAGTGGLARLAAAARSYSTRGATAGDAACRPHAPQATPVLRGVTLEIAEGEFFFLLGPSGCGKSTLLRIIAGLETLDAGSVRLGTQDWSRLAPQHRGIGFVFQSYALWPHLSVKDNLALGLKARKLAPSDITRRINNALELVELGELAHRMPQQLSGGQQQRVALARAIALEPTLILLDEPLSNLDRRLRDTIRNELKSLQRKIGTTMIFVTHDQEEALSMGDRVALLFNGVIAQCGSPQELYRRPASPAVAKFLGDTNLLDIIEMDTASLRSTASEPLIYLTKLTISPPASSNPPDELLLQHTNAPQELTELGFNPNAPSGATTSNATAHLLTCSIRPEDFTIHQIIHHETQASQDTPIASAKLAPNQFLATVTTTTYIGSGYLLTAQLANGTPLHLSCQSSSLSDARGPGLPPPLSDIIAPITSTAPITSAAPIAPGDTLVLSVNLEAIVPFPTSPSANTTT